MTTPALLFGRILTNTITSSDRNRDTLGRNISFRKVAYNAMSRLHTRGKGSLTSNPMIKEIFRTLYRFIFIFIVPI